MTDILKTEYKTQGNVIFTYDESSIDITNNGRCVRLNQIDIIEFLSKSDFLDIHNLRLQKSEIAEKEEEIDELISEYNKLEEQHGKEIEELEEENKDKIEKAKKGQMNNLKGMAAERLSPFLEEFPWNPNDVRYLGTPIDYVVFDGLTDGELKKIIFVDAKLNKSGLSKREKIVRECVIRKDFDFAEMRMKLRPEYELKIDYTLKGQKDITTSWTIGDDNTNKSDNSDLLEF